MICSLKGRNDNDKYRIKRDNEKVVRQIKENRGFSKKILQENVSELLIFL